MKERQWIMDTLIYFLLSIAYLILLLKGILLTKQHGWVNVDNVILLVILALFYDNGILALGKYLGEGELLKTFNQASLLATCFFHPFTCPICLAYLGESECPMGKKKNRAVDRYFSYIVFNPI